MAWSSCLPCPRCWPGWPPWPHGSAAGPLPAPRIPRPAGWEIRFELPAPGRCTVVGMSTIELFTIGQLSRRTGVPARTIRFWSDQGLVPPTARSAAGYRLYDAEAVARLDLIQTLREL